jgi:hypothetical protein
MSCATTRHLTVLDLFFGENYPAVSMKRNARQTNAPGRDPDVLLLVQYRC